MRPSHKWALKEGITPASRNVASRGHYSALLSFVDEAAGSGKDRLQQLGNSLMKTLACLQPALSVLLLAHHPASLLDSVRGKLIIPGNLGGFNGRLFEVSSYGYVQSPVSTCVTTTRAAGAP